MADVVQFYISAVAANAVDVDRHKFRARDRVPDARAETNWRRTGGRCRVTCHRPIAEILLEELRAVIATATTQVAVDECGRAIVTVEDALARLRRRAASSDQTLSAAFSAPEATLRLRRESPSIRPVSAHERFAACSPLNECM